MPVVPSRPVWRDSEGNVHIPEQYEPGCLFYLSIPLVFVLLILLAPWAGWLLLKCTELLQQYGDWVWSQLPALSGE